MNAYVRGIELLPDDDDDKRQEHSIQNRQPRINVAGNIMMRLEARVRHAGPHEQEADNGQQHGRPTTSSASTDSGNFSNARAMVFGNQPSEPHRKTLPEPVERKQADTPAALHRSPCLRGVIAPISQERLHPPDRRGW